MDADRPDHDAIPSLRSEIDEIDEMLCRLVRRRTDLSRRIVRIRAARGGPRIVPGREREVRRRYAELGDPGTTLAGALLRLGRGPDEQEGAP